MSYTSVFTNSCVRIPIDPISKMPKTAYERTNKILTEQNSIDSTTCSMSSAHVNSEKVKDFYQSIPDYNEINHLSPTEFYCTLQSLREKKKVILGITENSCDSFDFTKPPQLEKYHISIKERGSIPIGTSNTDLNIKTDKELTKQKVSKQKISNDINLLDTTLTKDKIHNSNKQPGSCLKIKQPKDFDTNLKDFNKERSNTIHSACSISWHDDKLEHDKNEIDTKFVEFFQINKADSFNSKEFQTQSMPSSPLRSRKNKNFTVPKPFKMTKRDDEERIVNELRMLQRSFSEDMLNRKLERKQFRAKPVPIESRIPLYDKILEDQAMRRAITKINSEAELRAQMKPFSFTKREEKGLSGICERAVLIIPNNKKKKRYRARPVPKNLFSNYFYDKMKEDDFFRSINRRIRAEEMLRSANYPRNMACRDRSRLSTPAAHSDLPTDPSPDVPSNSSSGTLKCSSPTKGCKSSKDDFITTTPQPFRFKTATRANEKMLDIVQKVYQSSKNTDSVSDRSPKSPAYCALELKAAATGRSNLAAVLRAESVRRRFEMEAGNRQAQQQRRLEIRQRGRQLRSKPAWHLIKNNHEEDIAMRLQTRRDEERMRREEFLHEMELMYRRVQQQPLLFERYYAPRSYSPGDSLRLSPRKCTAKNSTSRSKRYLKITTTSEDFDCNSQSCTDINEKVNKLID